MDEFYSPDQPKDLHGLAALQEIEVRPNITIRPLAESDALRMLDILSADPEIRDRVSVASRLHEVEDVIKRLKIARMTQGLFATQSWTAKTQLVLYRYGVMMAFSVRHQIPMITALATS